MTRYRAFPGIVGLQLLDAIELKQSKHKVRWASTSRRYGKNNQAKATIAVSADGHLRCAGQGGALLTALVLVGGQGVGEPVLAVRPPRP
jgi:hypothetical protein